MRRDGDESTRKRVQNLTKDGVIVGGRDDMAESCLGGNPRVTLIGVPEQLNPVGVRAKPVMQQK